jgi:hypothetical protein
LHHWFESPQFYELITKAQGQLSYEYQFFSAKLPYFEDRLHSILFYHLRRLSTFCERIEYTVVGQAGLGRHWLRGIVIPARTFEQPHCT